MSALLVFLCMAAIWIPSCRVLESKDSGSIGEQLATVALAPVIVLCLLVAAIAASLADEDFSFPNVG